MIVLLSRFEANYGQKCIVVNLLFALYGVCLKMWHQQIVKRSTVVVMLYNRIPNHPAHALLAWVGSVVNDDGFTSVSSSRISVKMIRMIVSPWHEPRETSLQDVVCDRGEDNGRWSSAATAATFISEIFPMMGP